MARHPRIFAAIVEIDHLERTARILDYAKPGASIESLYNELTAAIPELPSAKAGLRVTPKGQLRNAVALYNQITGDPGERRFTTITEATETTLSGFRKMKYTDRSLYLSHPRYNNPEPCPEA